MKRILVATLAAVVLFSIASLAVGATGNDRAVYVLEKSSTVNAPEKLIFKRCSGTPWAYSRHVEFKFVAWNDGTLVLRCL